MTLTTLRIAWRNLGRNRKRTAFALSAIAVAQIAILFSNGFMHGYADLILESATGPFLGHVQVHEPTWREERALDLTVGEVANRVKTLSSQPGVSHVAPRLYNPVLAALKVDAMSALVLGLDGSAEHMPGGLLEGVPEASLPGSHRVVLGKELAKKMGAKVGDELAIIGQDALGSVANDLFKVGAVADMSVDQVNRMGIVMSLADAQELFALPEQAHELVIYASRGTNAFDLAARLSRLPELKGLEVLSWDKLVPDLAQVIQITNAAGFFMLVLIFFAGVVGIANTMIMSTFERTRELGMLLALGCEPSRVVRMILLEAVTLGVLGVILGSLVGGGLVTWLAQTGIDLTGGTGSKMAFQGISLAPKIFPRLEAMDILSTLVAVFFTSIVAGLWPAAHAARLEPVQAIRA